MSESFCIGVDRLNVLKLPSLNDIFIGDQYNFYINYWRGHYSKDIISLISNSKPNLYLFEPYTLINDHNNYSETLIELRNERPTLLSIYNLNYLHFLYETIGRILYLDFLKIEYNAKILIQGDVKKLFFSEENWASVGIKTKDDLIYSADFKYLLIENSINTNHETLIHLENYSISSKLLRNKFRIKGSPTKNFYISRKNAISDPRFINDEEKIEDYYKSIGYEIVYNENLTFDEQRNLYKDAKNIVGISGTGLINILFAPDECTLTELRTSDFRNDDVFQYVCGYIGNEYKLIECFDSKNFSQPVIDKIISLK